MRLRILLFSVLVPAVCGMLTAQAPLRPGDGRQGPASPGPAGAYRSFPAATQPAASRPAAVRTASGSPATPLGTRPTTQAALRAQRERDREIAALQAQAVKQFDAKEYDQARRTICRMLDLDPELAGAWYNLACAHCRLGNLHDALASLRMAVELGFTDFGHMERDEDLAALREHRLYRDIVARKDEFRRDQAERSLQRLQRKMGEGYLYEVDHHNHIIFATDVDRKTLDELKRLLTLYARIQWRDLFSCPFDDYVTVVVPKQWKDAASPGYYTHASRTLVCRSVGMVLMHEFTHALHQSDASARGQRHPLWITEGLATLFETSRIDDGTLRVEPNHRAFTIRELVAMEQCIPWRQFMKFDRNEFMAKSLTCYAQARYIMMFLYESGMLRSWYNAYTDNFDRDQSGIQATEMIFGKGLAEVEADWKKWVLRLPTPPLHLAPKQACLGVVVESVTDGLRVTSLLSDSGAGKAGLRAGDVIVKVDGRRVVEHQALLKLIAAREAGDQVRLEIRRDGQYQDIVVTLEALPDAKRLRTIRAEEEKAGKG